MLLQEMETRIDNALTELEQSFARHQRQWQLEHQALEQQLQQSLQREATLREQNALLVRKLNNLDGSSDQNPLINRMKILRAHVDALVKDAAAFHQSCHH
ncbi:hypothetical protein [Martelella alba]|uniref:MbeD/MobD like protein n=1 Tax=Martelella alba TaxID=2590451 RepID=A0ABY2SMF2_9HYPH|nr:hypothetical protein [Martelella alba]TKI06949.1 hypothetical protein FCN80_08330 [Martelella alba]